MAGPTVWSRPPRLRTLEDAEEERRATWLELFFDLVFVVAVGQVANRLSHDTSTAGFLRFAGLFVPVLWAWTGFTFYANRFDTDDAIYRATKCLAMLGMAALAVSVKGATTDTGSVSFALSYVGVRALLLVMYARARRHVRGPGRGVITLYLAGFSTGAALWLVSLAVPTPWRFFLWGAGLLIDMAMPFRAWGMLRAAPINAAHITERFGLFFIIVLGESIIAVVSGTTGVKFGFDASAVAVGSFVAAVCLWWIYFDLADTSVIGRGRLGLIYVYGHLPLLAGMTAVGAGVKLAIKHAAADALPSGERWAICGGVVAYLLSLAVFHLAAEWTSPRDRALLGRVGLAAALCALAAAGAELKPLVFMALVAAGLLGQLVLELLTPEEGAASVWQPDPERVAVPP